MRILGCLAVLVCILGQVGHAQDATICRLKFDGSPDGDGDGWAVDSPQAEFNLVTHMGEVTKTRLRLLPTPLEATDPKILQCAVVMMTEPGNVFFSKDEAAGLRTYLLKGGFLWADDFWGDKAWAWWIAQLAEILPLNEYPVIDLPLNHPMFHQLYDVQTIPQVPNIGLWMNKHQTSERGVESGTPHLRVMLDRRDRPMVVMTFNTDFGDAMQEEKTDPEYFRRFSVPAYAIAINMILYSLSH